MTGIGKQICQGHSRLECPLFTWPFSRPERAQSPSPCRLTAQPAGRGLPRTLRVASRRHPAHRRPVMSTHPVLAHSKTPRYFPHAHFSPDDENEYTTLQGLHFGDDLPDPRSFLVAAQAYRFGHHPHVNSIEIAVNPRTAMVIIRQVSNAQNQIRQCLAQDR